MKACVYVRKLLFMHTSDMFSFIMTMMLIPGWLPYLFLLRQHQKKTFSHYQWDNFHFYGLLLQIYPFFALALRSNKTCRVKILWRMDVHDNGMCLLRPCGFHSRDIITQCTKLAFKVVKLPLSTLYFDFRLSLTLPAFLH